MLPILVFNVKKNGFRIYITRSPVKSVVVSRVVK